MAIQLAGQANVDIHCLGKSAVFTDLEIGSCFGFNEETEIHIAIKFGRKVGTKEHTAGIVVWPGYPTPRGHLPIVHPESAFEGPLIHFPKAMFAPSPHLSDPRLEHASDEPGFLNCRGRVIAIAKGERLSKLAIDLHSGERISPPSGAVFYVSRWKIVQPDLSGYDYDVICEYPAPVPV